jgi:hypothetical protein
MERAVAELSQRFGAGFDSRYHFMENGFGYLDPMFVGVFRIPAVIIGVVVRRIAAAAFPEAVNRLPAAYT